MATVPVRMNDALLVRRELMLVCGFTADYATDLPFDQARNWNRTRPEQAAHIIAEHTPPS